MRYKNLLFVIRLMIISVITNATVSAQGSLDKFMIDKGLFFEQGMVHLHDSSFIAKTETKYAEYLVFEREHSQNPITTLATRSFVSELPWPFERGKKIFIRTFRAIDSAYDQTSFHNDMFFNGPVVGVTYEQAKLFCEWKSSLYTKHFNEKLKKNGDSLRVIYRFRLPTESEWRTACGDIRQYDKMKPYPKVTRWGLRKLRMRSRSGTAVDLAVKQDIPSPPGYRVFQPGINFVGSIYDHSQNSHHCFNMVGNVAEMVEERGVALGGSWVDGYDEIMGRNLVTYYGCPEYWLGFRYVCDVFFVYRAVPDAPFKNEISLTDSCVAVRQRQADIFDENGKNDSNYLESQIKEWVRKDKNIPITNEVIYINGKPTISFETIPIDSGVISVRIPYALDSVDQILANYARRGEIAPSRYAKRRKGEFDIYMSTDDFVQGLFINIYYQGNRRTFFRVLTRK